MLTSDRLLIFSPLPPQPNGIATHGYILRKFFPGYRVTFVVDHRQHEYLADSAYEIVTVDDFFKFGLESAGVRLFQFGNNRYQAYMYEIFMELGGIAEIHEEITDYYQSFLPEVHKTQENLTLKIADRADKVIVHSWHLYFKIKSELPKIQVFKLDTPPLLLSKEKDYRERAAQLRARHGLRPDVFIFGAFGFYDRRKMYFESLKAFLKLKASNAVFIAGGLGVKKSLNHLVPAGESQNVILNDYFDDVDLSAYIYLSDMIINFRYPHFGENSGIVALAMSLGKCVLLSNTGSFAEYPDKTVIKIECQKKNFIQNLSRVFKNCMENREMIESVGEQAGRFSHRLAGEAYLSARYQEIVTRTMEPSKRLLVIATFNPCNGSGMSTSFFTLTDELKTQGWVLDFIYYALDYTKDSDIYSMRRYFDRVRVVWPECFQPDILADGISLRTVDEWCPEDFMAAVREEASRRNYTCALANHIWTSLALTALPATTRKILFTHDNFAERAELFIRQGLPAQDAWFSVSENEHDRGLRRADVIWAVQAQETEYFQSRVPDKTVLTISIPLKLNFLPARNELRDIGWLASDNPNNRDSLSQIISAWNAGGLAAKGLNLNIAGRITKHLNSKLGKNIVNYGIVDDIQKFYEKIDLNINPDNGGTGIKIKSLESLSFGRPLVCTANAAKGLDSDLRYHRAMDTAEIMDLISELSQNISEFGKLTSKCRELFLAYRKRHELSNFLTLDLI